MSHRVRFLIVFASCAIVGVLSDAFAQSNQYALPLWIPAGIAIAAVIVWGGRMLGAVFLAEYVVNTYQFTHLNTDLTATALLLSIPGASLASTLAAWAAARLGRRVMERDPTLGSWTTSLQFVLFVGPIAAAISSTLATLSLVSAGEVVTGQSWTVLAVWWKGDALGGLLICPALLSIMAYTGFERSMRARRVLAPLTLITATIVLLNSVALTSEVERDRLSFEKDSRRITERVRTNYERGATFLRSTARFISTSGPLTTTQFADFAGPTMSSLQGIEAIAYVPIVSESERASFELNHRASMPLGITQADGSGGYVRAATRPRYAPLTYIVPTVGGTNDIGLDLLTDPQRATLLRLSSASRSIVVSAPLKLLTGTRGVNLIQAIMPDGDSSTRVRGYAICRIDAAELLTSATKIDTSSMGLIVRDLSAPASNRLLDVIGSDAPRVDSVTAPDVSASVLNDTAPYTIKQSVRVDGRTWQLEFVPTPSYAAGRFKAQDWILLISDLMVGISTASFVLFLAGNSVRTEHEIARRIDEQRSTEHHMQRLIDTAGEAFISIDRRGIVLDWNPEAERMFGWSREEALGAELAELIVPDRERATHRAALARYQSGNASRIVDNRIEMTARRRDGSEIQVEMLVTQLAYDGNLTFHAFLHDISERKQLELERQHATDLKTHFVAMASHEMRTPLTSIIGFAQTLGNNWDDLTDTQKRQFVRIIQEQSSRFGQLIEDLLTISQIEAGRLQARPQSTDVRAVIEHSLTDAEAEARIECPEGLCAVIGTDHLRQIMINYLRNAQKYGDQPVTVRAYPEDGHVVVEVSDSGDGVPEQFVPRLFEQFSQAHYRESGRARGVGLGLSIVKAIVELYGGTAWYRPGTPRGAVFGITVPIARQSAETDSAV